jgi:hypothetical protein
MQCGPIENIRKPKGSIGFAYILFETKEAAQNGLKLNGSTLDNRVMNVCISDPNTRKYRSLKYFTINPVIKRLSSAHKPLISN